MESFLRKTPWRKSFNTGQSSCSGRKLVKVSKQKFNRLSVCSWDEFDVLVDPSSAIREHKQNLKENKFKVNLYPSDGQPCACVCTWQVTLLKKIPGKTRKCKIEHYIIKDYPIRVFTGRITIFEDKIAIWGSIKDGAERGEDFELTLTIPRPLSASYSRHLLEGPLMRGNRKKGEPFEQTHDGIVLR